MSDPERDVQRLKWLERLFGCEESETEEAEETASARRGDDALRREAEGLAELLREAAKDTAPDLRLGSEPTIPRRRRFRGYVAAAAVLLAVALLPAARLVERQAHLAALERGALRLVVSGPQGFPDGAGAAFRVETWDLQGEAKASGVEWRALDAAGEILDQGSATSAGALDVRIPPRLEGVRAFEVTAVAGATEQRARLALAPDRDAPLAHLSVDKPVYRPGERIRLRAVLLDRLQLKERSGTYRFRLVDAQGSPIHEWRGDLEAGVHASVFDLPPDARGGDYAFELRSAADDFTFESVPFLVRSFERPRLSRRVELDRESYEPGATGHAEITVIDLADGPAAGAAVDVELVVDGHSVSQQTYTLDEEGKAVARFDVPAEVERGDARIVARARVGGLVETTIRPFLVPTGRLSVEFFPEGGDLVVGVPARLYAQVRDALGRTIEAAGTIVDSRGRTVADFRTEHQGRARFEILPIAGESYTLHLARASTPPVPLPSARASGVVLRSLQDAYAPGEAIELAVETRSEGPWICAAFCRGVLVAQDAFHGAGSHAIRLEPLRALGGVLRVTVFDAACQPVAERLVHRASGQRIVVELAAAAEPVLPGSSQSVQVTTRDESGQPVSAVVGLTVIDRSVRELAGNVRVGLVDQTEFLAEVEQLEDVEDFLTEGPEADRRIDLLLGTEGWRRFAWWHPDELRDLEGERGLRLLAREGVSSGPNVADERGDAAALIAGARRDRQAAKRAAGAGIAIALLASIVILLGLGIARLLCRPLPARPILRPVLGFSASLLVTAGALAVMVPWMSSDAMPEVGQFLAMAAPRAAGADGLEAEEPLAALEALGYVDEDLVEELGDLGYEEEGGAGGVVRAGWAGDRADIREPVPEVNARVGFLAQREKRLDGWVAVREYAHRRAPDPDVRADFTETVFWHPLLRTDAQGNAEARFDLSDAVTTWTVTADAHGAGRVGQGEAAFVSVQPLEVLVQLPAEATAGDELQVPLVFRCRQPGVASGAWQASVSGALTTTQQVPGDVPFALGAARAYLPLQVGAEEGDARIQVDLQAGGMTDRVSRSLRVVPPGFPHAVSRSGVLRDQARFVLSVPDRYEPYSLEVDLTLYPSPLADILGGLDGLLQEPYGCFEQASSVNYPNVLAMSYLEAAGAAEPSMARRARELLASGYQRLTGYECAERGYEWFGASPPHEALSAYGLLQFVDMSQVFDVDPEMLARTRAWLLSRRDGAGGFQRDPKALDSFGRAPDAITHAYITHALAATGTAAAELVPEVNRLREGSWQRQDPYELALAACTFAALGMEADADQFRDRLKDLQQEDGRLEGASTSITHSGGRDLVVETTSWAILAWLGDEADAVAVRRAVSYLQSCRGSGRFGTTQATIMALKALTAHARSARRVANDGTLSVQVNGRVAFEIPFQAGRREALRVPGLAAHLEPGDNVVELRLSGDNEFPYAADLRYFSDQPADEPDAALRITVAGPEEPVTVGQRVTLAVRVDNARGEGLPMAVAVVGLPAGLEIPAEILRHLQEAGAFDFWELSGREITLYWRSLAPDAVKEFLLDTVAQIPGTTTGPASRVWLYYTPTSRSWAPPLTVEVRSDR